MNKITVIGRLGKDAELRYTPNGQAVTSGSIATDRKYTKDGQKVTETVWFKFTMWGKFAEALAQYLLKGKQVMMSGHMTPVRDYTAQDGTTKNSGLEFTVEDCELLGSGNGNHAEGEAAPTEAPAEEENIPF